MAQEHWLKGQPIVFATAFAAGLASGAIKTVEGVVSLGAELLDLGAGTDAARDVEQMAEAVCIDYMWLDVGDNPYIAY